MSVTNGYTSLAELKGWAFPSISDTNDDAELEFAINAVSRWIDAYCQRRFWKDATATTRTYTPTSSYELDVDDIVSVTSLKTDAAGDGTFETTWSSSTDYQLWPLNPLQGPELEPYRKIITIGTLTFPYTTGYATRQNLVELTAVFGWPAVPDAVKQACLIQSARVFKRKDSPEGVLGFSEVGTIRVGPRLDPDVAMLLAPYRKYPVMVG